MGGLLNDDVELLAAIQVEMSEFARLVEVRNHLCRQTELCRSSLETGQMLFEGQQRLDQVVQRREQLAAELDVQQLRLAAAGREMESLDGRLAAALNAKFDKRSAALDKSEKLLAALTRVAEEALQPLVSSEKRGNAGPCGRGVIVGSKSVQGRAIVLAAGREPKRADVPPVVPTSVGGMHTLHVTTSDLVDVGHLGRQVAGLTAPDPHVEHGARASRHGSQRKIGKRYSSDSTGDGPSAREQRKRKRNHLQEHERLHQADGSLYTEEKQVALAMALSESVGSSSLPPAPSPTPTPNPAPTPHVSLLVTFHGPVVIRARAASHSRTCSIDRHGAC